jgi:anaerobic selenocysteine-containing dehydrogenase
MTATVPRTCHLCEATCGLLLTVDGPRVTAVRGDPDDPFSQGYLCPKAVALIDLHDDPDWLRTPMRRTSSGGFEPIDWDTALDLVTRGLADVGRAHGTDAVAIYQGNPTVHNLGAMLYGPWLIRALRTRHRYSATSVDQLPHHVAAWSMYGHQLLIPIPDVDRTDFLLLLGSNPEASNGSLMTAPDLGRRMKDIAARGGQVVLVDPRRTESTRVATAHHFIRPGTDALLLAAMLQTLFAEGLTEPNALAPHLAGLDGLAQHFAEFTPERVAGPTGIAAPAIRALTRAFAAAPTAVCHGRMGLSTQAFGGLCQWMCQLLNLLTGNLDRPGGALFTTPALNPLPFASAGSHGRWKSRVRGLAEFMGELPVATLAEDIATPGDGRIRALICASGNPVLSTPDGVALDRALASLDFMVSVDPYITETSRHAHIILPPASPLTRDHYDAAFYALAVRNVANYSPPVFPRPAEARHDWEIYAALTTRLARRPQDRLMARVRQRLGPARMLDIALRQGPYGSGPRIWKDGLRLQSLRDQPSGMDLGPLKPQLPGCLHGRDRIVVAPQLYLDDLPRLRAHLDAPVAPLVLVGRRQLRSNNSWMHNSQRLVKGKPRCTLLVHPTDAEAHGLNTGDRARLRSRVGEVEVPVEVSDEMMPGVVSLPHGWGHGRPGVGLRIATAHAGVSMNDLTDANEVDALTGTAVLNGVPVTLLPLGD